MPDLLHWVRCLVALYDDDMEALPGGDNDPVPSWDDVMRELRKAIADADGSTQAARGEPSHDLRDTGHPRALPTRGSGVPTRL
jgi:hypothetical protein